MGAKSGQTKKQAGGRRLALAVFGALFVLLFVGYAIADGIDGPSVPSGDVALVQDIPGDTGHISKEAYEGSFDRQVKAQELKKAPKEGTAKYEEIKNAALGELINIVWIGGEAEELGITVTEKQVENELASIKKQNFPTTKAYQEFLETSNYTQAEVDQLVEVQIQKTKIQEQVTNEAQPASNQEISDYYEAEKEKQFTEPPTRDVRVIVNKDKAEVEKAKEALEEDNSPANWKKAAEKYSSDPTTKSKGGLQKAIPEELLSGALKEAIYDSEQGELVGPTKFQGQYLLTEVVALNPEKVKSLGEVRSQISTTLTQEKQQEHFNEFATEFQKKWTARTVCASGYEVESCSNFKGLSAQQKEFKSCFEVDPKTPPTECPAPVGQTKPALPGSATKLKPEGEPFVQRAQSGVAAPTGAAAEGLEGAAPEAAPETGE